MSNLLSKYKKWYLGKYIPPENDPRSLVVRVLGHYKRPFLAKILSGIAKFWLNHWKWILGFLLGIATLIVAILALTKK